MTSGETFPRFVVIQYVFSPLRTILLTKLSERRAIAPLVPGCQEGECGTWHGTAIACYSGPAMEKTLVSILEQNTVEYVFSLGVAGVLSKDLKRGDLASPVASVRGDGSTDFWADARLPAVADAHALVALRESAQGLGVPLATGIFYTTASLYVDGLFVKEWGGRGVVGIDRISAPLLLLSHLHRKKAAALYVLSDSPPQMRDYWLASNPPTAFANPADIIQIPIDGCGIPLDDAFFKAYARAVDVVLGAIRMLGADKM